MRRAAVKFVIRRSHLESMIKELVLSSKMVYVEIEEVAVDRNVARRSE